MTIITPAVAALGINAITDRPLKRISRRTTRAYEPGAAPAASRAMRRDLNGRRRDDGQAAKEGTPDICDSLREQKTVGIVAGIEPRIHTDSGEQSIERTDECKDDGRRKELRQLPAQQRHEMWRRRQQREQRRRQSRSRRAQERA
jgi:hypothetical protein